ncbi:hypothetical protein E0K89_027260, partial [Aquicoccus sp. SCR17]|nr:hypothetical protein [Carideicomes alvinocaridis]
MTARTGTSTWTPTGSRSSGRTPRTRRGSSCRRIASGSRGWRCSSCAYRIAIERTDTEDAPWFIVPADRKWFARLAVQQL